MHSDLICLVLSLMMALVLRPKHLSSMHSDLICLVVIPDDGLGIKAETFKQHAF